MVEDVAVDIIRWEKENQNSLTRLAALMAQILSVAKKLGGKVIMQYDDKHDRLVFHKNGEMKLLPDDLYSHWSSKSTGIIETHGSLRREDIPGIDTVEITPEHAQIAGEDNAESETVREQPTTTPVDVPFSSIIAHGVQNGFRHFFRNLPCDLATYRVLCTSLSRLPVDVARQKNLQEVVAKLKTGDDDYDPEERRIIKNSKNTARDAAFILLFLFITQESVPTSRDTVVAYNAVQYIISHRRKFKYRTRKMVREAFESRFATTYKQRAVLDKWPLTPPQDGGQDDEKTTEEEFFDYGADSDWSD